MARKAVGKAKPLPNEPERPIIVKKIVAAAHGGHHGGAWKIAYADFVTAMMAFFLLMWLLGMTDEEKRKGLADYFSPTLIEYRQQSAGSNGILGGDSVIADDNYPHKAAQTGNRSLVIPRDATGGSREATPNAPTPESRFVGIRDDIEQRIARDPELARLRNQVSFTITSDGLRIDLVDRARFSMFHMSTAVLRPEAARLVATVAQAVAPSTSDLIIRGHTDGHPYPAGSSVNNWTLSATRAETTRRTLISAGVAPGRIARLEGAADKELLIRADPLDPRNRRISITIAR